MNCPDSERLAAYAEGRLDSEESALCLEHCADCEECRRELAVLELAREEVPSPVPPAVERRALRAVLRTFDRPVRHTRFFPRERRSYAWIAAAAAIAVALLGIVFVTQKRPSPALVKESPKPQPPETRETPAPPEESKPQRVETAPAPKPEAPRKVEVAEAPKAPEPPKPEERRPEPAPLVQEEPKPRETKVEEPAKPAHTVATRTLTELQVTDFSGPVTIRRKGSSQKEKPSGVMRLGDGDLVVAEKPASFQVEGRHPVVLGENTTVSLAYVAQEEAPYLHIRSGEATVDSTGPTRWIVSDGKVAMVIKQARARFATAPGADRLVVSALTEPLYVEPDGGSLYTVRPGEELQVGKALAEVRKLDLALVQKKAQAFDLSRPRHKTIFYASFDPADQRRDGYFVQDGAVVQKEAVVSKERTDKTAHVVLSPNPRFTWREGLFIRFRFRTNATLLQVSLPVEEKKFSLFSNVTITRKEINQWVEAELPVAAFLWRDEGGGQRIISTVDKFDALRFSARQQDVFGDQRVTFLIDDVQVIEREK
jgi:outer membrane biosynthesis protein TonB